MKLFKKFTRNRYLIILDIITAISVYIFTKVFLNMSVNSLAEVFIIKTPFDSYDILYLIFTVLTYLLAITLSKSHQVMWCYAGTKNYIKLTLTLIVSAVINTIMSVMFFTGERFAILYNLIFFLWAICSRMTVRGISKIIKIRKTKSNYENIVNILIIGAGDGGNLLLHDLTTNMTSTTFYNVIGFLDDDDKKKNSYIEDVQILGSTENIKSICEKHAVEEIHIAIPSLSPRERTEILNKCSKTGCKLKIMDSVENTLVRGDGKKFATRDVEIDDLLARDAIILDNSSIEDDIKGKVVMVTGGGGSIGSELCRQIAKYSPEKLIVLDIYENNAYDIQMELKESYPDLNLSVVIASVRDAERIDRTFETYKPHIIFHAAAHKHVPLMEVSPGEAVKNNVFGTYNVAKFADKHNVSKFVMISTDKAVNPTNVMGATKRMCEMIIQAMAKVSKTKFVAVRFGNVLGSNGSVIPLFKRQIAHGGPVTVTHKDITRFFMTIPEAAQLVIQAAANAAGGEIFVLDMGSPVRIYDLAENIIRLSGYRPNIDIPIKITGLRPGEKLYEELLMSEEGLTDTAHEKIFIGKPMNITLDEVNKKITLLSEAVKIGNPDTVKEVIHKVVPTYKRTDN